MKLRDVFPPFEALVSGKQGLMNATGTYVLTINCDEYCNLAVVQLAHQYFSRFPESWVLRLSTQTTEYGNQSALDAPWQPLPDMVSIETCSYRDRTQQRYEESIARNSDCPTEKSV